MNREMLKTSLVLMFYTLVAGLGLSLVYVATRDRIAQSELQNVIQSMVELLSDAEGRPLVPAEEVSKRVVEGERSGEREKFETQNGTALSPIYTFRAGDETFYVLSGYSVGYGGNVLTMAAFVKKADETLELRAIKVLDYSQETPGLGAKIGEPEVQRRFYGIPSDGLNAGVKVDKDAQKTVVDAEAAKAEGIVKVSDVMTGATITPRAVANAINAMYTYLTRKLENGGE